MKLFPLPVKSYALIASLPRSRTAWLSAWLSGGNCYAFHDGACRDDRKIDLGEYADRLASRSEKFIADCSSGIIALPEHANMHGGPIIWIERDPEECRKSWLTHCLDKFGDLSGKWSAVLEAKQQFLSEHDSRIALKVDFRDLSNLPTCAKIWSIVAPGEPFDAERCDAFQRLIINEAS